MVIDLAALLPLTPSEAQRFVDNIHVTATGCWEWTAGKTHGGKHDDGGYGKFYLRGQTVLAHRLLYTAWRGPIADTLDHRPTCTRACIHPWHVEDVPIGVNVLRGNGIMAQHARKTHCKRGHELAGKNLVRVPGGRMCRICRNTSYADYRRRKKARGFAERCTVDPRVAKWL